MEKCKDPIMLRRIQIMNQKLYQDGVIDFFIFEKMNQELERITHPQKREHMPVAN